MSKNKSINTPHKRKQKINTLKENLEIILSKIENNLGISNKNKINVFNAIIYIIGGYILIPFVITIEIVTRLPSRIKKNILVILQDIYFLVIVAMYLVIYWPIHILKKFFK